jgi:DNA-binding NtrC family response regulator
MDRPLALVVDGDAATRTFVREVLDERGIETVGASDGREALDVLRTRPVAVLLADLNAPGVSSSSGNLPREASRVRPTVVPVVITSETPSEQVLSRVGEAAFDVLEKPLDEDRLKVVAQRAVQQHGLMEELQRLRRHAQSEADALIGRSSAIDRVRERVRRLASGTGSVLFVGEAGTGRQVAARALHSQSPRRNAPFVTVDGHRPADALQAELFGREGRGGLLREAQGGSLYVEGFDVLPPEVHEALVLAVQGGRGDAIEPGHDVRLLAGAVKDRRGNDVRRLLAPEIVEMPPLRERLEDVPQLAMHFIEVLREINHLPPIHLAPEALAALEGYAWPGNVRELRQVLEQAVILAGDGTLRLEHLPERVRRAGGGAGVSVGPGERPGRVQATGRFRDMKREVVEAFERAYLDDLLMRHAGNVTAAAHHSGMLRSALQRLLRKYDLRSAEYRRRIRRQGANEAT